MDPVLPKFEENKVPRKMMLILGALVLTGLVAGSIYWLVAHKTTKPKSPSIPLAEPRVRLNLFAKGLPNPTAIVSTKIAGDDRLFVLDQSGVIRIVDQNGSVTPEPLLDIRNKVLFSGEMGLLGLAFSPNYSKDGDFFVNSIDKGQNTVIARYPVPGKANNADGAGGHTALTLTPRYQHHNGGRPV